MWLFSELNKLSLAIAQKFPYSEIFLVGGAVRDLIMNRPMGDVDVVVRNVPLKTLIKFLKTQGKSNLVGKNFGVIKFFPKGSDKSVDIALPRTDHAFNTGGYRDVKVAYDHRLPIEKDLERRDFTCNAIALQINDKFQISSLKSKLKKRALPSTLYPLPLNLIDPFGGVKDIQKKVIRAVGNPEKRFQEDYTRMLRALRFSCQLGFKIEAGTWKSIKKNVTKINQKSYRSSEAPAKSRTNTKETSRQARRVNDEYIIARELIAKEFLKGMYYDPVRMLELMDKSGLLRELIPELLPMKTCKQDAKWHSEGNVWRHTLLALKLAKNFQFSIDNFQSKKKLPNYPITQLPSHFSIQEILELYLAILFHDIAKPQTYGHEKKRDTKAITYYGHESIGAGLTRKICDRLKLSAPDEYHVDTNNVMWLVKNHMLLHPENAVAMRNATLEKYFFNPLVPGKVLLGIAFFDGLASIPRGYTQKAVRIYKDISEKTLTRQSKRILKRWPALSGWWLTLRRLKQLSRGQKVLPRPLLDGHEIMKILNMKPGPQVGKAIEALREAQLSQKVLSKKQARQWIALWNRKQKNKPE